VKCACDGAERLTSSRGWLVLSVSLNGLIDLQGAMDDDKVDIFDGYFRSRVNFFSPVSFRLPYAAVSPP
jgi:hypothetical protein